jgi:hypothetical protein
MDDQNILDNAPKGALGIKIMDGFYRWVLKDNTPSKLYECIAFYNYNQIFRSLADIERIVELESVLKEFRPRNEDGDGWDFVYNEGSEYLGEAVLKALKEKW